MWIRSCKVRRLGVVRELDTKKSIKVGGKDLLIQTSMWTQFWLFQTSLTWVAKIWTQSIFIHTSTRKDYKTSNLMWTCPYLTPKGYKCLNPIFTYSCLTSKDCWFLNLMSIDFRLTHGWPNLESTSWAYLMLGSSWDKLSSQYHEFILRSWMLHFCSHPPPPPNFTLCYGCLLQLLEAAIPSSQTDV